MKKTRKNILVVFAIICVSTVYAQPLDSLFQQVVENNPELKALQLEYQSELLNVDQVRQLPNPQVGLAIPVLRPETRLGPQVLMVSASQMFPWFGALQAKEDVVISMSKVRYESIAIVRLELFNQVKVAYATIAFIDEKIVIIDSMILHFEALSRIVTARVETNATSMANVLMIQLRIDDLKQQVVKMDLEKRAEYAVINGLTNHDMERVIHAKSMNKTPLLMFNIARITENLREHYPLLMKLDKEIELSQSRALLNRKMNNPSWSFSVDYAMVKERTDMSPAYNGRDIFIPKVMVTVPLYRKSYRAKDRQELLIQDEIMLHKKAMENRIVSELIILKTIYDRSILDIELGENQLVITDHAYAIMLTEYSVNGRNFDDLLELENLKLDYKMKMVNGIFNATRAVIDIERYTDF